jgi:hypothetical protein
MTHIMNRLITAQAALLGAALLASCSFDKNTVQDITGPVPGGASVRFFNFGVNAPGVNFYANTQKMTAITSATGVESTTGIIYGGVGGGGDYSAIIPGQYTLTGKIAATTDKDLAIATVAATTLADAKYYSYFMSGFYDATAKSSDAFVVEDPWVTPTDFTVASVRLVNAISNSSPMILYAKNPTTGTEVALGAAVTYKGAGAFVSLPAGSYDLSTRATGSATNLIVRTGVSFLGGHAYTVGARGDMTVVSTTATNRPFLDNTANR